MKTEIELKLSLPKRAATRLSRHPLLLHAPSNRFRLRDTYYDTDQLTLKQNGLALRFRKQGRLTQRTVKATSLEAAGLTHRAEWERATQPGVWDFSDVDHAPTHRLLEKTAPDFHPLFHTDFQRWTWQVTYRNAQIELALDRGTISSGERRQEISEVELELMQGDAADLFAFALELQETLPLRLLIGNKAETGYRLHADTAKTASKAVPLKLRANMSPVGAFRHIAFSCLNQILRNQDGIASAGPEFLHQTRVGLRRLRAALKLFSPALPEHFARDWNAVWRQAGQHLGEARNLDVFCTQTLPGLEAALLDSVRLKRLRQHAEKLSQQQHDAVEKQIASPEHARNLLRFASAVWALPERDSRNLNAFIRKRLNKLHRRARIMAKQATQFDNEERHALRLAFKKLRYPLEALAALLPGKRSKAYLATLAALQEAMGQMNDCANAQRFMAGLLREDRFDWAAGWLAGQNALLLTHLPEKLQDWLAKKAFWK